jgi:hypothetical protein
VALRRKYAPASKLKVVHLNGQIAVIGYKDDEAQRVNTFEHDRIKTIYWIASPAKLTRLPPP